MNLSKISEKIMYLCLYIYTIFFAILPSKFSIKGIPLNGDSLFILIIFTYILNLIISRDFKRDFTNGVKNFFADYLSVSIFIVITLMFISINKALIRETAINESIRFSTYLVLYFIIKYHLKSKKIIDNIIKCYIFTVIVICTLGIIEFLSGKTSMLRLTEFGALRRIASTLENPNNFGAFLIFFVFPIGLLAINEKVKTKKVFYFTCLLLSVLNIIITGSRNVWLALALGTLILLFMYSKRVFILIVGVGTVILFLPPVQRLLRIFSDISNNSNRLKVWKTSYLMAKEHLLNGVGIGNYNVAAQIYMTKYPELYIEENLLHPHNAYLKIFAEVGFLAGICFIIFLIIVLIRAIRFARWQNSHFYKHFYTGFAISLVIFILMNLVDNFFSAPKVIAYFWILIACFGSLEYNKNKEIRMF